MLLCCTEYITPFLRVKNEIAYHIPGGMQPLVNGYGNSVHSVMNNCSKLEKQEVEIFPFVTLLGFK